MCIYAYIYIFTIPIFILYSYVSDEKCLLDYPLIQDGTKINLVVKRTDEESILRPAVVNFLRSRFNDAETQKIADEFMKVSLHSFEISNLL